MIKKLIIFMFICLFITSCAVSNSNIKKEITQEVNNKEFNYLCGKGYVAEYILILDSEKFEKSFNDAVDTFGQDQSDKIATYFGMYAFVLTGDMGWPMNMKTLLIRCVKEEN